MSYVSFNASGDLKHIGPLVEWIFWISCIFMVLFIAAVLLFVAAVVYSFVLKNRAEKDDKNETP